MEYRSWQRANNVTPKTLAFVGRVAADIVDAVCVESAQELSGVVDSISEVLIAKEFVT